MKLKEKCTKINVFCRSINLAFESIENNISICKLFLYTKWLRCFEVRKRIHQTLNGFPVVWWISAQFELLLMNTIWLRKYTVSVFSSLVQRYTQERCNADLPSKLCHSGRFIFCKTGIIILKNIRLPKHKQILQCFIVPLICQTALTLLITVESAWSRPEWLKFSITLYCC